MTKEEAIKEAYGEYWEKFKSLLDENGYVNDSDFSWMHAEDIMELDLLERIGYNNECVGCDKWRPVSLLGLENNNGWIKIGDGKELPCESINCFIDLGDDDVRNGSYFKSINDSTGTFFDNNGEPFLMDEVEAFYPIEKPKQRIY